MEVDWTYGAEHMWDRHRVSVREATEAANDPDALLFDPDPKSRSGSSARLLGYSSTARTVLVLILVDRDDRPGSWWGAAGWPASIDDRQRYRQEANNE